MNREVAAMDGPGGPGDDFPSIEDLRQLQLRAVLHDLVNNLGPGKAAERLRVDPKTLRRGLREASLSPRLAESLERLLLEQAMAAATRDRERINELEERVAGLEGQLQRVLADLDGSNESAGGDSKLVEALRAEWAGETQRLQRRMDRLELAQSGGQVPISGVRTTFSASPRRYPDLATRQPADDDQQVYGAAYPLIRQWRALWVGHSPQGGRGLDWALTRERILELELAMLEEHGLTLPPETAPLAGPERREQVSWRERELARVRTRRARLELLHWLRRALTLGRWR